MAGLENILNKIIKDAEEKAQLIIKDFLPTKLIGSPREKEKISSRELSHQKSLRQGTKYYLRKTG